MPFDHIIMNPPYCRNLHLKILREAMRYSDEIVNLSPIRWLQDPLAEYKRGSDWKKFGDIREKIADLEVIDYNKAESLFGVRMHSDLGIYLITKEGGWQPSTKYKSFVEKIMNNKEHWSDKVEHNKVDGIRVKTLALHGAGKHPMSNYWLGSPNYSWVFIDGMRDGKWWTEFGHKNQCTKEVGTPLVDSIKFTTVEEAKNFEKTCWTKFMIFCNKISKVGVHTNFDFLPFMPTYTHPWTDEMLYEYFGLTPEEIDIIEKEISK